MYVHMYIHMNLLMNQVVVLREAHIVTYIHCFIHIYFRYVTKVPFFGFLQKDLDHSLHPDLMFLDWFTRRRISSGGSFALSCPDILFEIDESGKMPPTRQHWKGGRIVEMMMLNNLCSILRVCQSNQ
jgi:hypothetical protein